MTAFIIVFSVIVYISLIFFFYQVFLAWTERLHIWSSYDRSFGSGLLAMVWPLGLPIMLAIRYGTIYRQSR